MLRISKKLSNMLSLALVMMFFAACVGCAFILPTLVNMIINTQYVTKYYGPVNQTVQIFVYIIFYSLLGLIMFTDVLMMFLLLRVYKGMIFTQPSVSLIRGVSWSCIYASGLIALLGIYFRFAFIMAFLALFLGLCVRVVKNVIEEATAIKTENDLTV